MDFDADELNDFKADGEITKQAGIKIDKESGRVSGWDSIWAILELEEKDKTESRNVIQAGINDFNRDNDSVDKPVPYKPEENLVDSKLANLSGYVAED